MFSMPILDVAIGLSFFYLLLGLVCTTINEMISGMRQSRAKFLAQGVERLLGPQLKTELLQHPLIASLAPAGDDGLPSYIPAEQFATALLDILSGVGKSLTDISAIKDGLPGKGTPQFQKTMQALIDHAQGNAAELNKRIQTWFNDGMDRVSGWYKRNAQLWSIILAVAVTLVLNADTLSVAKTLWTNPAVRAAVVEQAKVEADKQSPQPDSLKNEKEELGDLVGWSPDWITIKKAGWPAVGGVIWDHLLGWILTAIAVSLGAPFWFDTLNRFMNIRNAGRAPDEPRDKTSTPPPAPAPTPAG